MKLYMGITMPPRTGCVCSIVMYDHTLYAAYVYYEFDIEEMM